jgi:hypothetical protein
MFKFDVLTLNQNTEIEKKSEKTLYPINYDERADVFCNYGHSPKKENSPNFCGMSFRGFKHKKPLNSFSFMSYEQNPVRGNGESVYIQNGVGHRNRGVHINKENILDVVSVFAAKRLIVGDWINWYDEYTKPTNENEEYRTFSYDSLIYSLFNVKSSQASFVINIDGIEYKTNNQFFWISADVMKTLADTTKYDNLYNNVRIDSDRYLYTLLFGEQRIYDKLSHDAKLVLNRATELVEKSMELRQVMANDENHLDFWDAGYTQLKPVWKEYFQEDFKEFKQLYKNLEDRMRPFVYKLGFLIK